VLERLKVEKFKYFENEEFDLSHNIVLAGPNNSGKTTVLQALSTWYFSLQRWLYGKGRTQSRAKRRTGQPITRKDFTALPIREFDLLWHNRSTALRKSEAENEGLKPGFPRTIQITVEGTTENQNWSLTMELRYQGPEQIYAKPLIPEDESIPEPVQNINIVHSPPFSGLGPEEAKMDPGAQALLIGQGKPGDIIRNLLLDISKDNNAWNLLKQDIEYIFNYTLIEPDHDPYMPFIKCDYLDGVLENSRRSDLRRFEIGSAGSGFHQVLLLLSFLYARPASVLLIDEPDAHLHVILQRQIYDRLRSVARERKSQLLIATHSEVIIDGTDPENVMSFLGNPHRLTGGVEKEQVREALKTLTTLDILLSERKDMVLYCEGETDFRILSAFAEVLEHPAREFFKNPFFHPIHSDNLRDAKQHLFALKSIRANINGLLIIDGSVVNYDEHDIKAEGLNIFQWNRYEIENYLLVPEAIKRYIESQSEGDLFTNVNLSEAEAFMREQLPPNVFSSPLDDVAAITHIRASKDFIPELFQRCNIAITKAEYYQIVEHFLSTEVHSEIVDVLDRIAAQIS